MPRKLLNATLNRRTLIGALAVGAAVSAQASSSGGTGVDPRNPLGNFGALYRKLRYRSDDGHLFWWLSGTKYGQVDNELRPLHSLEACAIIRVRSTGSGFDATSLEHVFYTDLETGRPLERMLNPFSGEMVQYRRTPARAVTIHYDADASFTLPETKGGPRVEFRRSKGILVRHGGDVWLQDDSSTTVTPPGGTPSHGNDWSTFRARFDEIARPGANFVAATVHMQSLSGWQGWMKMGERRGGLTSRIVGAKVASFDDVPASWRSMLQSAHPEVARDPLGALDAN